MTASPPTPGGARNAVRCLDCDVVIDSLHRHDFKWCPGGHVAVDGGPAYKKRCFKTGARFEEVLE